MTLSLPVPGYLNHSQIFDVKTKKSLLRRVVERKAMKELGVLRETQVDSIVCDHICTMLLNRCYLLYSTVLLLLFYWK